MLQFYGFWQKKIWDGEMVVFQGYFAFLGVFAVVKTW